MMCVGLKDDENSCHCMFVSKTEEGLFVCHVSIASREI